MKYKSAKCVVSPVCFIDMQGGFNVEGPLVCTLAKETAFFIFTVSQVFSVLRRAPGMLRLEMFDQGSLPPTSTGKQHKNCCVWFVCTGGSSSVTSAMLHHHVFLTVAQNRQTKHRI